jgi:hypothetical protein
MLLKGCRELRVTVAGAMPPTQQEQQPKTARPASMGGRGKDRKKRGKKHGQEPITRDEKNRRKRERRKEKKQEKKLLEAEDAARAHQGLQTLLRGMPSSAGSARGDATSENASDSNSGVCARTHVHVVCACACA